MDQATSVKIRKKYILQGYNHNQIECLMEGISKGVDVSAYENPEFISLEMNQILQGLISGVDVSVYAKKEYDWFQMEEIRKGLERNVDITKYMDPKNEFLTMREIRRGLEQNIDLTGFMKLNPGKMRQIRLAIMSKLSILDEINAGYDDKQLAEIREAMEKGIRVQDYVTPAFRDRAIKEVTLGLEEGIDVSLYAKEIYSWKQMKELRLGIEHRVDISKYSNKLYSDDQMLEIRLGLEEDLDIDKYKSFMYTAREMRAIRNRLLAEAEKEKQKSPEANEKSESVSSFQSAKVLNDLEVEISEDGMEAYINLSVKKTKWNSADLLKTLFLCGVKRGIISEQIDDICNSKENEARVLIAKGKEAENGLNGYYEYFFNTDITKADKDMPETALDYQNYEWYDTVKKGQKLAEYHMATSGTSGFLVTGEILFPEKGKEMPMLKGRGFIFGTDQKSYFASMDGKITYNDEGIWVVGIHILENVTSTQGQQYYDGMVIVKGLVGNGATLEASDDIIIEGYVEAANIVSGGSILIKQGMNASNGGSIHAKKMVIAKYFEAVSVYAGQRLQADYCMNCDILTEGKVVLIGDNGSLIGGNCRAQEGMIIQNVGNRASIPTSISIGVSEELRRSLDRTITDINKIHDDLDSLKRAQQELMEKYSAEVRNTMDVFLKLDSAIFTKNHQLQTVTEIQQKIKNRITQIQYSGIRILNDLYENVNVEIDGVRWVSRVARNVTLKRLGKRISVYQNSNK